MSDCTKYDKGNKRQELFAKNATFVVSKSFPRIPYKLM